MEENNNGLLTDGSASAEETKTVVKRDTSSDKKRIKKAILIIVGIFAAIGILLGVLTLVLELLQDEPDESSLSPLLFFEADYNKNIYDDVAYTSLNRNIYYEYPTGNGMLERPIDESNAEAIEYEEASFFVDYFNCIIEGDYESYPSFFSEEYIEEKGDKIPEKFTMQALYNIRVKYVNRYLKEGTDDIRAVYEVSYQIFENNGTFRSDIYPDEEKTIVFKLDITNGSVLIYDIIPRSDKVAE